MRIVLDCERMKYQHTGIFEYCRQLAMALRRVKAPQDQVSLYLNKSLQTHFDPDSTFINQKSYHKFIFPTFKDIELWHSTFQLSSYIPKNKKIKRVLTVHDLNFLHEDMPIGRVNKMMEKHQENIDAADHIVVISSFVKAEIQKHLDLGKKPVTIIYNGCAEPPALSDSVVPSYLPVRPFLFALGTVNPKKNFHVLIPLLAGNDFELIIAGDPDPDYKETILKEAAHYQVSNRVKIIGAIAAQDKYWYYKNCEAFLFPSIAEGFGIPPVEAMRFGKPTFLANATSLPEIGGPNAYYFNHFDPATMQRVFIDGMEDFKVRQPAQKLIEYSKQFNWDESAQRYLDVYKQTLNK